MKAVELYDACPHLSELFRELVPGEGQANTFGGEVVRAVNRIVYRYLNDGDMIGQGYGRETVNPPVRFLLNKPGAVSDESRIFLINALDGECSDDEEQYSDNLYNLMRDAEKYCDENPNAKTANTENMWDYATEEDSDDDEDWYEEEEPEEYSEDEEW